MNLTNISNIILEFIKLSIKRKLFIIDTFTKYKKSEIIKKKNIYAFIDLQTTRSNFDIIGYLAYLRTLEIVNKKKINIVILPDNDPKNVKLSYHKENYKDNFFMKLRHNNITLKCLKLIENFEPNVFIMSNRQEAEKIYSLPKSKKIPENISRYGSVQPENYYKALIKIYNKKKIVAKVVAQEAYIKLVKQYLKKKKIENKKIITITLRNSSYRKFRNANVSVWQKVYNHFSKKGYYLIIINDFENSCFDINPNKKLNTYNYANLDIDTRLALYELAYLNISTGLGSGLLLQFSKYCKFIDFCIYTQETAKMTKQITSYDISKSEHFPWYNKFQKFIGVKNHNAKNIIKEINLLIQKINKK